MSKWNNTLLDELTNVIMGQSPPSSTYNSEGSGLPFLQGCADFGAHYPLTKIYCSKPQKIAPKDSLLISVRAPVGDTNRANIEYAIGRGLAALVATKIDSNFLEYVVQHQISELEKVSQGSTFLAINTADLKNLCLLTPLSIAEQRKIAHILSTCSAVIEKTETAIAKYKAIKLGMMQALFTRGLDKNGKLRPKYQDAPDIYKKTELGWIPKEWEINNLGTYSFITKLAGFEYTLYFDYSKEGSIVVIRALNIKKGRLNLDEIHTIPRITSDLLPRSKLSEGDLVISYVGTLGQVAIIPDNNKFHLAPNVAKICVDKKEIVPEYLNQFLNEYGGQKEIFKWAGSTTQAALSMQNLREVLFKKPSFKEQKNIAAILQVVDTLILTEENHLTKITNLKRAIMSVLLTGKVRVKYEEENN